ncbi:heat shock factor-binding protein 1 [Cyclospora cayetanensis]|uniref:Heat shock factor-binding protein 1 n=1 Tax=Cyclospora cayetanensis TaxID=88456 RepID=A0A1D3D405_9EIME|nr:heat shock factor-binding protein 1 [Cyclospora cayetanensis]
MSGLDVGSGGSASPPAAATGEGPSLASLQQQRQQQRQDQSVHEVLSNGGAGIPAFAGGPVGSLPPRVASSGAPVAGAQGAGELSEALQELLQDMNAKFASLSSSILGKLDDMACKLDGLERQLTTMLAEEEGENPLGCQVGPQGASSENL